MPGGDREARKAARREQLFGRAVASLDRAELIPWLREFTDGHPNPRGILVREANRWLAELEGTGGRDTSR